MDDQDQYPIPKYLEDFCTCGGGGGGAGQTSKWINGLARRQPTARNQAGSLPTSLCVHS